MATNKDKRRKINGTVANFQVEHDTDGAQSVAHHCLIDKLEDYFVEPQAEESSWFLL